MRADIHPVRSEHAFDEPHGHTETRALGDHGAIAQGQGCIITVEPSLSGSYKNFEYDEKLQDFYMKVEGYFSKIFDAFRKKDEKLAHQLWFEHRPLEIEGVNIIKNDLGDLRFRIKFLLMILKIFRSMTALIYS